MTATTDVDLDALLDFIKRNRGFDFTGYKRSSLERRITRRMAEVGCTTYPDYLDHLELHQDEFASLFNTILINVTAFFRDAPSWDYLRANVLPDLLAARRADAPIRVWCAGCASGEEAYTIAMVLAEHLGEQEYRERVKIYATDADEEALQIARQATYSARAVDAIPSRELLERYFERIDSRYVFRADLRRTVIFGRNDLVQDAPISRIGLLLCRNTLMYFNAETQAQILRRFQFALDEAGVMMLGKSEMLIAHADLFQPVDLKRRVFRKVHHASMRERLQVMAAGGTDLAATGDLQARDGAFDAGPVSTVVVDAEGRMIAINEAARTMFGLDAADVGRPLKDLELSYRPIELRSHLDRLREDLRPIAQPEVRWAGPGGAERVVDVRMTPLLLDDVLQGVSITYVDVTRGRRLRDELEGSKRELEEAYEELQSTVEELETTNEELQSTNEELETTNEELQSTNEELETMNEELQSTNEELETINDELRTRTLELDDVNAFLETILASMGVAVAVLDARQTVQVWNRHAEELWGVRADEVTGEHLLGLDIGLPLERVRPVVKRVLGGDEARAEIELEATDGRGRVIVCRVTALPLVVGGGAVTGVIVLMEPLSRAG